MIIDMKNSYIVVLGIILISFAVGIYFYPQMPEEVASHWNSQGQVDDYMSKFWGVFLMPIFLLGIFLLFILIPKIDPLKENIEKFRKYYDGFIVLISLFLFYVYMLTILWNKGLRFDIGYLLIPAMAILFYYIGIMMENAKRNWFIGIRTPWTLSSEKVWDKTHKIGGKLFKVSGAIILLGVLLPKYMILFILVPVIFTSLYTIIYSYSEYQKEVNSPKLP